MKVLVVSTCTGKKKFKLESELTIGDFQYGNVQERESDLHPYLLPAWKMYTGQQHLRLMEGIYLLRKYFPEEIVDLKIISGGYGLLAEDQIIAPYEVDLSSMSNSVMRDWASFLKIGSQLEKQLKGYDLVILLLSQNYLQMLELPFDNVDLGQRLIFLASKTSRNQIPDQPPYYYVEVGQTDAKEFGYGLVGLKGYLFKLLVKEFVNAGQSLFPEIYVNPKSILDCLEKYRK